MKTTRRGLLGAFGVVGAALVGRKALSRDGGRPVLASRDNDPTDALPSTSADAAPRFGDVVNGNAFVGTVVHRSGRFADVEVDDDGPCRRVMRFVAEESAVVGGQAFLREDGMLVGA